MGHHKTHRLLRSLLPCLLALKAAVGVLPAAAANAPNSHNPTLEGAAKWEIVYSLPAPKERWLDSLWVAPTGDLFAVGRGVIVHCSPEHTCDAETMPTGQHLAAVWGVSPTDVYAVGSRGLVMHYNGKQWNIEKPIGPREDLRRDSLFVVGPFLPDTIVAGNHSFGRFKRTDGKWVALSERDGRQIDHWRLPEGREPCEPVDRSYWLTGDVGNRLWVTCADGKFYKQDNDAWVLAGPNLPKPCRSYSFHGFWNGSLFLSVDRGLVCSNEGGHWRQESPPAKIRAFSSNSAGLYAVTAQFILKRSR